MKKLNQKTHKSKRKKAGYSVFFPRKVFRCISTAVLGIVLMAFPAMAQETVLISPNALAQLQNVSPADGGVQSLTMRADEFFTGASGITSAAQFIEELKKYQPSDWTSAGNNGSDCFFQDGSGSLLLTFETSGNTLYVTADGASMSGIISKILSINSSYAAQAASGTTAAGSAAANSYNTTVSAALSTATWHMDAMGWWYDNGNGTWPANGWHWIDGNHDGISECYYFNENGYILTNTITPDSYLINGDGAWVQDGIVQVK